MRILYLHNTKYNSNMANLVQVKAMCKAMSEEGHEVILSLPGKNKENIKNQSFEIHLRKPVFKNSKIDKYINHSSVKKTINKFNPDLVYLRTPLLLNQAMNSRKPIVMELHNNTLHQGYKWLDKYWKRYLLKVSETDQIKKLICISQALKDYWIEKGVPKEKLVVAHDAIDQKQFEKPLSVSEARVKLNLPQKTKIVTYLGRLYKNRKIESILELAKTYTDTIFLVVGGPDSRRDIYKEEAEKFDLENITFVGQVPHEKIIYYLYASDVLLALWSSEVPTINYCSPLKLFEYMAAGRTIVAHGFPTIKEVLTDGENALLVKPDSIEHLIEKTAEALNKTDASEMPLKARELVLKEYTWQRRAEYILSGVKK